MSDVSAFFAIRMIEADNTQWWAVTAPINCVAWSIQNNGGNAVQVTTDQVNIDTLPPGSQDYVPKRSMPGAPYVAGTIFCYVKGLSGTPTPVAARFAL